MRRFVAIFCLTAVLGFLLAGCSVFGQSSKTLDLKFDSLIGVDVAVHHEKSGSSETNTVTFTFKVPGRYHLVIEPDEENAGTKLDFDVTVNDITDPLIIRPHKLADAGKITVETNGAKETHEYGWRATMDSIFRFGPWF